MFIDWLTLLLVNMMVALVLHSLFMFRWDRKGSKMVIPGFLLTGAIALIAGFRMVFTWPLPGPYNIIYGELSVLFGAFLFMAAPSRCTSAGICSPSASTRCSPVPSRSCWESGSGSSGMTSEPLIAGLGFVVTGATASSPCRRSPCPR